MKAFPFIASMLVLAPIVGCAQQASPRVGLRVSGYVTMPVLVNRGALTGVGKDAGYAFRTRPGIMGDVLVDYKPRGEAGKWTFSSGLGIWWWSYRVGLRRDALPADLFYLPSEGQGAIALQVPLRVSYRVHPAIDIGAGLSLTKHLEGSGSGSSFYTTATDRTRLDVFSVYASRPYTSLTGDVFLTFRASKRIALSIRGTMDSDAFAPVAVASQLTNAAGSRNYTYSGAPRFFLYSFGMSYAFF